MGYCIKQCICLSCSKVWI